MPFNTAIFYDVENLLKGYNFSQQVATNLSLTAIVEAVRQTGRLGQIAVQRAYANWSDPRLGLLRGEINELGIEPIQVFGFSRDQKKNAADIQLAIDAVDLAHVRPALEIFVIVSGDGGFASLAKKLHEYGKTVIGCAYRSAASKIFRAVCDEFIWLADPDEEEENGSRSTVAPAACGSLPVTDPRNIRLAQRIKPLQSQAPAEVLAKVREVLQWYATDPFCRTELSRGGIFLSVVQEAVKYAVPNFQSTRLGFPKFSEYVQYVCTGTPLCVARPANSQAVLALRQMVPDGAEILSDLDSRDLHSLDGYRSILATGSPVFRLPDPQQLQAIVSWLCQNPPVELELGSIIEGVVQGLNGAVSTQAAKQGILCFVGIQAFEREPEGSPLSEQKLTLLPDVRSPEALMSLLRHAMRTKLANVLGQVRDEFVQQLLGEPADTRSGSASATLEGAESLAVLSSH